MATKLRFLHKNCRVAILGRLCFFVKFGYHFFPWRQSFLVKLTLQLYLGPPIKLLLPLDIFHTPTGCPKKINLCMDGLYRGSWGWWGVIWRDRCSRLEEVPQIEGVWPILVFVIFVRIYSSFRIYRFIRYILRVRRPEKIVSCGSKWPLRMRPFPLMNPDSDFTDLRTAHSRPTY